MIMICELVLKIGVGFIVVLMGDILMMFGLLKVFAVLNMDVDEMG